jgi:hypothetical protein
MGMARVSEKRRAAVLAAMLSARAAAAQPLVAVFDATGREIDAARTNASFERTPPSGWPSGSGAHDPDALRFVLFGAARELASQVVVTSASATGALVDELVAPIAGVACPPGKGPFCGATAPVRVVADDIDRNHPLVSERSVRAVLGGVLSVAVRGAVVATIRVGGPRMTAVGPMPRLRARLRVFIVRDRARGAVPFGGDDAGARALAMRQVALANATWSQCGITFGPESETDVRVVDPPPSHLIAVGCDAGLPARGGELHLRIDGRAVRVPLRALMSPRAAARALAQGIEAAGFAARISENARIEPAAGRSADVLVRRRDGQLANVDAPDSGSVSTDPTLRACIGTVDLADGLEHFVDVDAPAGTLEERTLIKAFDDGDPTRIDVFMVPSFSGGGRVGESFIYADRSSVRNVVVEDRAGIRADRASFALAHELGHILLDMPGHPDDFGLDTPTLLMDSDAADPTAFGPRRLTLAECSRAYRQSGPSSPVPLLVSWPLGEEQTRPLRPAPTPRPSPLRDPHRPE